MLLGGSLCAFQPSVHGSMWVTKSRLEDVSRLTVKRLSKANKIPSATSKITLVKW